MRDSHSKKVTTRLHNTFSFSQKTLLQAKAFTENLLRRKPVLKEKRICSFVKLFFLRKGFL